MASVPAYAVAALSERQGDSSQDVQELVLLLVQAWVQLYARLLRVRMNPDQRWRSKREALDIQQDQMAAARPPSMMGTRFGQCRACAIQLEGECDLQACLPQCMTEFGRNTVRLPLNR